ncbi:MAG: type I-G CRISPR-associated protein, Cas3-extension family [Acidimicrobiales bacterium]
MSILKDENSVALPALDGRDTLGFLAGLGVLRILGAQYPVRLRWDPGSGTATIHGFSSIDEIIDRLATTIEGLPDDELIPGLPADLLPARVSESGPDPAWIGIEELGELTHEWLAGNALTWVAALWTDLSDDKEGRCARTPLAAPAGKQSMRSMFDKPAGIVAENPEFWMRDALTGWTRKQKYTGEGFDSRAWRDAAEITASDSTSYGVPGATYLALAALPFFRLSGNGVLVRGNSKLQKLTRRESVGWYRLPVGAGRRRDVFAWPLWLQPLGPAAISILLDHREIERIVMTVAGESQADEGVRRRNLTTSVASITEPLGIWAVAMASRRKTEAGKSDGFLTVEQIWRPR